MLWFFGRPLFLIKAFQRIRYPRIPFLLISSSRSSLRHPISSACCLLGSRRCRLVSVISSSRAICLLAARRSVLRSVLRPALRFAPRLASRPVLPWMMSSPPCPIAPCVVRFAVISRPALLVGWLGAGRDTFLVIACPPCRRCLPRRASRLRAFSSLRLVCLLAYRRLCRYCGGEIVYMICPVAIIQCN